MSGIKRTKPDWSSQQTDALEAIEVWRRENRKQIFTAFGYAGTGKTTLINHLARGKPTWVRTEFDDDERQRWPVRVAAFTGKAAQVLRGKGVQQASTIHSMIYRTVEQSTQELDELESKLEQKGIDAKQRHALEQRIAELQHFLRTPEFALNPHAFEEVEPEFIVIDECSMISEELAEDLLSFNIPVLAFGDMMQLPPVKGIPYFMDNEPDVMLTQIHRQAAGNPIIQMATRVREGNFLKLGRYGDSEVVNQPPSNWEEYDQILVGRNITRIQYNRKMRRSLGYQSPYPCVGERLVCLRNNHSKKLLNGSIWIVQAVQETGDLYLTLTVKSDDDVVTCLVWKDLFVIGYEEWQKKHVVYNRRKAAEEFDFGYALTVHKAQGSEWDRVLLFDESYCFREKSVNWLYTGITRAAKQITIVK